MSEAKNEAAGFPVAIDRFNLLLEAGFSSEIDLAWFTGAHGLLEICRRHAAGHTPLGGAGDELANLLFDLDDRLVAISAPSPSQRAYAFIAIASADDAKAVDAARMMLLRSLVGDDAPAEVALPLLPAVDEVIRWIRGQEPARSRDHSICSVPIAVSTHAQGEIVRLTLKRVLGTPPSIGPDLIEAPFQRYDLSFLQAVQDAYAVVGASVGYRYDVRSLRTGLALDAVVGRSCGLGSAVVLRTLEQGGHVLATNDWIFTGDLAPDGRVLPLADGTHIGSYKQKLQAASGKTLMLPRSDAVLVQPVAAAVEVELLPVDNLTEAIHAIDRHARAVESYQRVLAGGRRVRPVAAGAVLLTLAVVVLLGWWATQRGDPLEAARASSLSENPLVSVQADADLGVTGFSLSRTEVTNAQYATCIGAGRCVAINGVQARPLSDLGNADFPVTGISASEAEVFCKWAYGSKADLPTFNQYKVALLSDTSQFPFGKMENADPSSNLSNSLPTQLVPVTDFTLSRQQIRGLAGNAAEWSRTACIDGECSDVTSIGLASVGLLRLFGVAYPFVGETTGPAWLTEVGKLDDAVNPSRPTDYIGFRCSKEE